MIGPLRICCCSVSLLELFGHVCVTLAVLASHDRLGSARIVMLRVFNWNMEDFGETRRLPPPKLG